MGFAKRIVDAFISTVHISLRRERENVDKITRQDSAILFTGSQTRSPRKRAMAEDCGDSCFPVVFC
jgi:hypothetical protein